MSKYEKLGNFLLFEKIEEDRLSKNFLAGQISNNQIQQIQVVKKFDPSLSTMPDFVLDLNEEFEIVKSLANPNIVRPNAFVREKAEFAAVFDYVEGKSLRAILNRCHQDGYPFTADHALLIGSRLCTALEYLHSKKANDERLLHGFVSPETVFVTYDGEIKLQYLGLMQALMKFPAGRDKLFHDFKSYLAPEVLQNHKVDKAADVYSAGLVVFEMLTGEALFAKARDIDIFKAINEAELFLTSGDRAPLPDDVKKVLLQALAADPAKRYSAIADMRKALDQILFTSDYAPTTFNLAFFMNSLFRESIDQEHKSVASLKKIDVAPYMKEEPPARVEHPVGAEAAKDLASLPLVFDKNDALGAPQMFGGGEAESKEKSKMPLILAAVGGVAVIGVVAFLLFKPSAETNTSQTTAAVKTMSPSERQADAAERQKLQEEAQKAQEEAKQKDVALKELQAKLDAMMKQQQKQQKENPSAAPAVDTAAIHQLQEQARRLEEEKKKQQALAEEKLKAAQQPPVQYAPPPDTTAAQQQPAQQQQQQPVEQKPVQVAAAQPVNAPVTNTVTGSAPQPAQQAPAPAEIESKAAPVKEGDVVDLSPDVVKPELTKRTNPAYPPAAQRKKIEGTVILSVLISERGDVADVKVLRGAGGSSGLNEAAQQAIKQWKFRPAVKDGKRVKVWVTYPIVFKLE